MQNAVPRYDYAGYRRRWILLFLFFFGYVVIALLGDRYSERREFFPVFSWSLFSHATEYFLLQEVVVHRIGDREFDPPIRYSSLEGEFRLAGSAGAGKILHRYVTGLSGPEEEATARRRVMESQLFDGKPVEYEIRRTLLKPLEHRQDGTEINRWSLGPFTTGDDR